MKFEETEAFRAFLGMGEAVFSAGALSELEKELIAVGVAVTVRCEDCIRHHIARSLALGASREQLREAAAVGAEMGGGPAVSAAKLAFSILDGG